MATSNFDAASAAIAAAKNDFVSEVAQAANLEIQLSDAEQQIGDLQNEVNALTYVDFLDLQKKDWIEEANVGNTNQVAGGHGTTVQSLNADGSRRFALTPGPGPNGVGYDNYFFGCHGLFIPKIGRIVGLQDTIKFKISDVTKLQGVEWENQRNYAAGLTCNMAICVHNVPGVWAYFAYDGVNSNGKWVTIPGIPYDKTMFSDWVTVVTDYVIDDDAKTKTHVQTTINGTVYKIGFTQPQSMKATTPRWDCNFQLDSKGCAKGSVPPPFYVDMFRSIRVLLANSL